MDRDPRKLAEILGQGALARLGQEAQHRRTTTAEIRRQLATPEAEHLVSATINAAGELVLVMDSPAWAARVRYACAQLPHARIIVKVQPPGAG